MLRGTAWEANFEGEFDIDNKIHNIIATVRNLKPFGRTPREFFTLILLLGRKNRSFRDMCKFYHLDEDTQRNLLLLIISLLIRSPRNRFLFEGYSKILGRQADEDVGKVNMAQSYRIAKNLCHNGLLSNQYFILLHSPLKKFIFGDGTLDWLTGNLIANRINGRTLIPLTPQLCVYFCTPRSMLSTPNCASVSVAPWMVDWINELTQIYSKEKLFFLGKTPKLTDAFRERTFLEHKMKADSLIDLLDDIAGNRMPRDFISISTSGSLPPTR